MRVLGNAPDWSESMSLPPHDVLNLDLAAAGARRIAWADQHMPVLAAIRQRFERRNLSPDSVWRPACISTETANLMRTLVAGG